jgi:Gram-negative porin
MIGGLKKTASALAIAAAAGVISTSAFAADLGGNCCADLEERVAELEATTARKGNRVVSLTVSGHVNEAIVFWDDGINSGMQVSTNGYSMTRFRFRGSAKINADWSAGYYLEFGMGKSGMSYTQNQDDTTDPGGYTPNIRHQALWIKSNTLGTIWLGHTTDAVDGMQDICLGCVITSSAEGLGWYGFYTVSGGAPVPGGVTWFNLGIGDEGYYGTRSSEIKYVSPSIAGFSLTANISDVNATATPYDVDAVENDYEWDIGLRYANEFNGVRVAGGVGYSEQASNADSWVIVGTLQHVATGLFIAANYKENEDKTCIGCDSDSWSVTAGIGRKWSSLGTFTFWGQYASYHTTDGAGFTSDGDVWAIGINQQIDAAAMELYLTYWNVSGDVDDGFKGYVIADPSLDTLNIVMAGARIKF